MHSRPSAPTAAGTIVEVTPKAAEAGLAVGQRVAYSVLGTYCEYTAVPAAKIVNVPDGVGLDTATACMTQGLTAHYLTVRLRAASISMMARPLPRRGLPVLALPPAICSASLAFGVAARLRTMRTPVW